MSDLIWHMLVVACIYGVFAISLNLQAGIGGLLNLGAVAFFGLGAYATGIAAEQGISWHGGMLGGMVLAAAAGAAVGKLGRSLAAEYWALATLALAEVVRLIVLNEEYLTGGPQGIGNITGLWTGVDSPYRDVLTLLLVGTVLVGCYLLADYVTRIQFGRVLRLIREQPDMAVALGHDVVGFKVRVLALSAAMAALAGSLYTHYISFVGPAQLLPFETFFVWTMVVVGGIGNHRGAVLGALLIVVLYTATRFIRDYLPVPPENAASIRVLLIGVVLLFFLLYRQGGLIPERLRKVAVREPEVQGADAGG